VSGIGKKLVEIDSTIMIGVDTREPSGDSIVAGGMTQRATIQRFSVWAENWL